MVWLPEHPPNWDEILEAFPFATRKGIFFAYGDTVYSPSGVAPTADIVVHERVHFRQQAPVGAGIWWQRYIHDPAFRLDQEIEAYRAQLDFVRAAYGRDTRRKIERNIIRAISSPLYGPMASPDEARRRLAA